MILTAPPDAGEGYPTLGPQVVDWMHQHLVFGPGDLLGQPLVLDPEQQGFVWRFYELFPRGHPAEGRRRFDRCTLSLAKGLRKTELAAFVTAAEAHPTAPVRFNGWRGRGLAKGRGVTDPYIALVAYTEEQSDELCYGALRAILERCEIGNDFDIGLERILRKQGDGKVVSLSGSPSARDGARTTFMVMDETHRWVLPRLKAAHQTMLANLPKRVDTWALETTTAPEPGAGSVAEGTMDYARSVVDGRVSDAGLFFFHRQAGDEHDLTKAEGARAAVIEASGPAASWRNIDAVLRRWSDPTTDLAYWERVWANRLVKGASQAFDVVRWKQLAKPREVKRGALITLGFDGAQFHDSTAIVATDVEAGYQWMPGLWECPEGAAGEHWQVPTAEVDALVHFLFSEYRVWRLYADPPYWQSWIAAWAGEFDKDAPADKCRVIEWWTNRRKPMTMALENYRTAMTDASVSHDGDPRLTRHLGNSRKAEIPGMRDEQGKALYLIQKERPDSPHKIDGAMAGCLSWEARTDAIAAGALRQQQYSVHIFGGRK